jgi:hypothetical protein
MEQLLAAGCYAIAHAIAIAVAIATVLPLSLSLPTGAAALSKPRKRLARSHQLRINLLLDSPRTPRQGRLKIIPGPCPSPLSLLLLWSVVCGQWPLASGCVCSGGGGGEQFLSSRGKQGATVRQRQRVESKLCFHLILVCVMPPRSQPFLSLPPSLSVCVCVSLSLSLFLAGALSFHASRERRRIRPQPYLLYSRPDTENPSFFQMCTSSHPTRVSLKGHS